MSSVEINQVLQQMRNMAAMAENKPAQGSVENSSGVDFSQLLKDSVNKVNETQKTASGLSTAFEKGDPTVSLSRVMVEMQKSSVSFQALTQVRNKLLNAYKEVMNMPV